MSCSLKQDSNIQLYDNKINCIQYIKNPLFCSSEQT